jgi:hypothetical protein
MAPPRSSTHQRAARRVRFNTDPLPLDLVDAKVFWIVLLGEGFGVGADGGHLGPIRAR